MNDGRLPAHVEVGALLRRAQGTGDFATILRKGDAERGSVLLVISSRGRHVACLERALSVEGTYTWQQVGPADSASSADVSRFLTKQTRFDADLWAVELDIADAERFIAETTAEG